MSRFMNGLKGGSKLFIGRSLFAYPDNIDFTKAGDF